MAERKPRATKREALESKLEINRQQQEKLLAKIKLLKEAETAIEKEISDLEDEKKKAERAAAAKAKRVAAAKAQKELFKEISKSGLSIEEIKQKLGF